MKIAAIVINLFFFVFSVRLLSVLRGSPRYNGR